MTIKFEGIQLGKVVPVSLLIVEHKFTADLKVYLGYVGNETALDVHKIDDSSTTGVYVKFKQYLDKQQIKLNGRSQVFAHLPEEKEIAEEYYNNELNLFGF